MNCGLTLLVLCGLPGSGKTELANLFKCKYNETSKLISPSPQVKCKITRVIIVTYDKLMPPSLEVRLIGTSEDGGESRWKQFRQNIYAAVEDLVFSLVDAPSSSSGDYTARSFDRETVMPLKRQIEAENCFQDISKENANYVVVIDDNMPLRSMRYQYFQLARKYGTGFCQVHVHCPTTMAKQRNRFRENSKVAEDVIIAMGEKIEAPQPDKNTWEKCSHTIWNDNVHFEGCWKELEEFVKLAMQTPVPPLISDDTEEKILSRVACLTNTIHQADKTLRKLISEKMTDHKGRQGVSATQLAEVALQLNNTRLDMLNGIKLNAIVLPESTDGDSSDFSGVLTEIFNTKIK